jgi:hypothetical protein
MCLVIYYERKHQSHEWFYAVMGEKRIFEHFFRLESLFAGSRSGNTLKKRLEN